MNWKEYFVNVITLYRQSFLRQSKDFREIVLKKYYADTFLPPCQIEVLVSSGEVGCLLVHDEQLKDMEIKVQKHCKSYNDSEFLKKYPFVRLLPKAAKLPFLMDDEWIVIWTRERRFVNLGRPPSEMLAEDLFTSLEIMTGVELRKKQVGVIKKSTDDLMVSIGKLPDDKNKSELIIPAKEINDALEKVKQFDIEIGKLRQLVGVSQEYQDWKVLVSDVLRLKGEHVPREVFDAKMERLDQRIEKGLESLDKRIDNGLETLNTRIEDLKAIKFWSKRTLLEIALAILATLTTLYGAGILKF